MGGQDCEPDISGIAFSPSGRRIYVGTEGGLAGVLWLVGRCCLGTLLHSSAAAVWVVLLAPLDLESQPVLWHSAAAGSHSAYGATVLLDGTAQAHPLPSFSLPLPQPTTLIQWPAEGSPPLSCAKAAAWHLTGCSRHLQPVASLLVRAAAELPAPGPDPAGLHGPPGKPLTVHPAPQPGCPNKPPILCLLLLSPSGSRQASAACCGSTGPGGAAGAARPFLCRPQFCCPATHFPHALPHSLCLPSIPT